MQRNLSPKAKGKTNSDHEDERANKIINYYVALSSSWLLFVLSNAAPGTTRDCVTAALSQTVPATGCNVAKLVEPTKKGAVAQHAQQKKSTRS